MVKLLPQQGQSMLAVADAVKRLGGTLAKHDGLHISKYRNGQWFTEPGIDATWGSATDVPLALPYAIRRTFFGA